MKLVLKDVSFIERWLNEGARLTSRHAVTHYWLNDQTRLPFFSGLGLPEHVVSFEGERFSLGVFRLPYPEIAVNYIELFGLKPDSPEETAWLLELGEPALRYFAERGLEWGRVSCLSEWAHRHEVDVETDWGSSGGPVGEDLRRYVPGLYWLNYFSRELIAERGLDIEQLQRRLQGRVTPVGNGVLVQLFDSPDEWESVVDQVDEYMLETDAFFAKRRLPPPPEPLSPRDHCVLDYLRQWP